MEPTSNSQNQEPAAETGDAAGEATHVCRVCQRSIPRTVEPQWREKLVHRACFAELRCGITLDGTAGRRTREQDRW